MKSVKKDPNCNDTAYNTCETEEKKILNPDYIPDKLNFQYQ